VDIVREEDEILIYLSPYSKGTLRDGHYAGSLFLSIIKTKE
jgi:hypothetical protein